MIFMSKTAMKAVKTPKGKQGLEISDGMRKQ
jgi:hypothetical protein